MLFFSKKTTIAESDILRGATDHHSHILPGVDDGVETMDEALHILATYEAAGVKTLWLTPHIMEDIPNTPQKLEARFLELKAAYTGNITLHLAAEYMIDNHLRKLLQEIKNSPSLGKREYPQGEGDKTIEPQGVISPTNNSPASEGVVLPEAFQETPPRFRGEVVEDRRGEKSPKECLIGPTMEEGTETNKLRHSQGEGRWHEPSEVTEGSNTTEEHLRSEGSNTLLPIGSKGNHLLVETSYYNPPMRLRETLRQIKSLGYHPLLAHPERYMYMDNNEYIELHNEGVKFQLNLPSICGAYGSTVKKRALWLLKNNLYDAIGSDTHCEEGVKFIMGNKLEEKYISTLLMLKNSTL